MNCQVVINADDLGLSREINEGIFSGLQQGVITDTSLLVKAPFAHEAVSGLRHLGLFSCGIHINLDEQLGWSSPGKERVPRAKLMEFLDKGDLLDQCYIHTRTQLKTFTSFGLIATHLDTHHHVHGFPAIFYMLIDLMKEFHIHAMRFSKTGYMLLTREDIPFDGHAYSIMEDTLKRENMLYCDEMIEGAQNIVKIDSGRTELVVHPSSGGELWRVSELEFLLSQAFLRVLKSKDLRPASYQQLLAEDIIIL
jgi:predicted glycoside hydrolase/deacetylase ChbG (UPF0249 family)